MTVKNTMVRRISQGPKSLESAGRLTERHIYNLGFEVVDLLENGSEARKPHSYAWLGRTGFGSPGRAAVPKKNIRKVHGFMVGSSSR